MKPHELPRAANHGLRKRSVFLRSLVCVFITGSVGVVAHAQEQCEWQEVNVPSGPGETTVALRRVCTPEESSSPSYEGHLPADDCIANPGGPLCNSISTPQWAIPFDWQQAVAQCEANPGCDLVSFDDAPTDEPAASDFHGPQKRPNEVAVLQAGYEQPTPAARLASDEPSPAEKPERTGKVGDPVIAADGSLSIQERDLTFPGPVTSLEFIRTYDSRSGERSTLGSNWTHNFDTTLTPVTEQNREPWLSAEYIGKALMLRSGSGGSAVYVRVNDATYYLSPFADGATVRETSDGWLLTEPDGASRRFDKLGYLVSARDRFGNGYDIRYEETPLYQAYRRYCSAYYSHLFLREDPRTCAALAYVFGEAPRTSSPTWGPVSQQELKTSFCDNTETFGLQCEAAVVGHDILGGDIVHTICPAEYSYEWACATLGWDRRSGKMPHPRSTSTRAFKLDGDILYHIVALPSERAFEEFYNVAIEQFPELRDDDSDFPKPFPPGTNELQLQLEQFLDRGSVAVEVAAGLEVSLPSLLGKKHGMYHTPENSYGAKRLRPVTVRDTLGRTLTFRYFETNDFGPETSRDNQPLGLLKEVQAPAGVSLQFRYSTPANYPSRLNEFFLFEVTRKVDSGSLPPGVETMRTKDSERVTSQTRSYFYNWPEQSLATSFAAHDFHYWKELASYRPDGARRASLETLSYISTVADNIIAVMRRSNVSPGDTIELETRYDVDPREKRTLDRVLKQRFGGSEVQVLSTQGWGTRLAEMRFEYFRSIPEEALGQARDDLPSDILARYGLEGIPATIRSQFTHDRASYLSRVDGGMPHYLDKPQLRYWGSEGSTGRKLLRTALDGSEMGRTMYEGFSPSAARTAPKVGLYHFRQRLRNDLNRITSWTRVTNRRNQIRYLGFNFRGQLLVDTHYEGTEAKYYFQEHTYNEDGLPLENRWPTSRGSNAGAEEGLTRFTYCPVASDVALAWRARLNTTRREHIPRSGSAPFFTGADGDREISSQWTSYSYEPQFNQPLISTDGVVFREDVTPLTRGLQFTEFEFDDSCAPAAAEDYRNLDCERTPFFCYAEPHFSRRIQAFAEELFSKCRDGRCKPESPLGAWQEALEGFRRYVRGERAEKVLTEFSGKVERLAKEYRQQRGAERDVRGSAAPRAEAMFRRDLERLRRELPAWLERLRQHWPKFTSTTCFDAQRNSCRLVRPKSVAFGDPSDRPGAREVNYTWAPHGLPSRLEEVGGRVTTVAYHDAGYEDALVDSLGSSSGSPLFLSPDNYCLTFPSNCEGGADGPDGRGFPAEVRVSRFDSSYSEPVAGSGCAGLPPPYQAAFPDCQSAQEAVSGLGLPEEVGDLLSAIDQESVSTLRFTRLGHVRFQSIDGQVSSIVRNVDGGISRLDAPDGSIRQFGRNANGEPEIFSVRDGTADVSLMTRIRRAYDRVGNILRECRELEEGGCHGFEAFAPDAGEAVGVGENPRFQLFTYAYDREDRLRQEIDPIGASTEIVYNGRGLPVLTTRSSADHSEHRTVRFHYNDDGLLGGTTYGDAPLTLNESFGYDSLRRLSTTTSTRGVSCRFSYDGINNGTRSSCGLKDEKSDPWTVRYAYDGHNELTEVNENGLLVQTILYGPWGRSSKRAVTGEGTSVTVFDALGAVLFERNQAGDSFVRFPLRGPDRELQVTRLRSGTEGGTTWGRLLFYDTHRLPIRVKTFGTADGERVEVETEMARNPLGWIQHEDLPGGLRREYFRNLLGWTLVFRERGSPGEGGPSIRDTTSFYNPRGELVRIRDAEGQDIIYHYNAFEQLSSVEYDAPQDILYRFFYDPLGRISKTRLPGGRDLINVYDERGDLGAINRNGKALRTWSRDIFGRIERQINHNLALAALFPQEPRAFSVEETFTRDALERIQEQTIRVGDGPVQAIRNRWEAAETGWKRKRLIDGLPDRVDVYDTSGRLTSTTEDGDEVAGYSWLGNRLSERREHVGETLIERLSYDPLQRLKGKVVSLESPSTGGAEAVYRLNVLRDLQGRVRLRSQSVRTAEAAGNPPSSILDTMGFQYRSLGELSGIRHYGAVFSSLEGEEMAVAAGGLTNGSLPANFPGGSPEPDDNQLTRTLVGSLEKLTAPGGAAWEHVGDRADGHELVKVTVDGQLSSIVHDDRGRITKARNLEYVNDEFDRLIAVKSDGVIREAYLYTADGKLAAVLSDEKIQESLVYDGDQLAYGHLPSGKISWDIRFLPANRAVASLRIPGDKRAVAVVDERNSPVAWWKASQAGLSDVSSYTAVGREVLLGGDGSIACAEEGHGPTCPNPGRGPVGFSSAFRSAVTGLSYMGTRWYSPVLGQFLTRDVRDARDSGDTYAYAKHDPVNFWDPTGREGQSLSGGEEKWLWFRVVPVPPRDPNAEPEPSLRDNWWWVTTDDLVFAVATEGVFLYTRAGQAVLALGKRMGPAAWNKLASLFPKSKAVSVEVKALSQADEVAERLVVELAESSVHPGKKFIQSVAKVARMENVSAQEKVDIVLKYTEKINFKINGPVIDKADYFEMISDDTQFAFRIFKESGKISYGKPQLSQAIAEGVEGAGEKYVWQDLK